MADKRYSLDDILNEYPKTGPGSSSGKKIDLDDLLNSFDSSKKVPEEKVTLHNTDIFTRPVAPDLSDISFEDKKEAAPVQPEKEKPAPVEPEQPSEESDSEDFEKKYANLSGGLTAVKERVAERDVEYTPPPKPERSFSEKMEQGDIYHDEPEPKEEKHNLLKKHKHSSDEVFAKAGLQSIYEDEPEQEEAETPPKKPVSTDPFDKYAAISESDETDQEAPAEKSIDDILEEYSAHEPRTHKRNENTVHRSITEFFTKIIPSDDSEISGNTELLDGMMKMKKERISRTQHIAPVERKSISDIDLNLDDKIIPDTASIAIDKEAAEREKLKELRERRSKKIKDFVLVGDEEETPEAEELEDESAPKVIEDFESFDDAPSIAADIAQLKNSLVMRMLVLIICFAASFYISLANDTGILPIMDLLNKHTQTNTYLFVNAIIGLLAAFTSYTVISCGLSKLVSLKADCDSLCAVATVTSIAASMIMFANTNLIKGSLVHIYVSAAILSLIFNTAGKLLIVERTQRSFRFVSGSSDKYSLFMVEDEEKAQNFTRGALKDFPALSAMRKTEFLSGFLKTSYASDSTDKFCHLFTPIVLGAALIVAILAGITARSQYGASGLYFGMSAFVACVSMCSAFSMMLVVNLPMLRASKKSGELQGYILGYDCIDEFADTNSVLVEAAELFPQGSVNLAGIKVFSDTRIDEAIVEAASLTSQSGSILKNMFYDIIAGKTELLNPVESYIFEDSMGLCGWINNKRVLLGSRELMINHSIEGIPTVAKEKEYTGNGKSAVYLSISGELSAMFIIELAPSIEVKQALENLQRRGIYTIVRTVDSLVSIKHLSELFEISPEFFKLIPFRVHNDFEEVTSYQPKQQATLACSGRFSAMVSLILSCHNLRGTISVGICIEAVSILLGILICLAMVILKSFTEITVLMTIIYNLVFTAVLMAFQLLRKN